MVNWLMVNITLEGKNFFIKTPYITIFKDDVSTIIPGNQVPIVEQTERANSLEKASEFARNDLCEINKVGHIRSIYVYADC